MFVCFLKYYMLFICFLWYNSSEFHSALNVVLSRSVALSDDFPLRLHDVSFIRFSENFGASECLLLTSILANIPEPWVRVNKFDSFTILNVFGEIKNPVLAVITLEIPEENECEIIELSIFGVFFHDHVNMVNRTFTRSQEIPKSHSDKIFVMVV